MNKYPWYEIINRNEQFLQGDFINSCPILIPPPQVNLGNVDIEVREYDIIIMSQSCDLTERKVDLVLVCPVWQLSEFGLENNFFKGKKGKEALRRGNVPGYHLLNKCEIEGFVKDFLIVDFRNVYSVPFNFLMEISNQKGERMRLLPPYREHLSQAFARFFMRVGLPVDIPSFK